MLSAHTLIYGIIGNPVRHSLSPLIHNRAFKRFGMDAVYLAFEVKDLSSAIKGIRGLGIKGVSVTIPFKEEILSYLDEVDSVAREIGAVNTVLNREGILVGYNTDWIGALMALEEVVELRGKRVLVMGTGGSARAVIYGLVKRGSHITVIGRSVDKAQKLAEEMGCGFVKSPSDSEVDVIVNCTPLGMYPMDQETPFPEGLLRRGMVVMDVVYQPLRTRFLREAERRGCLTIDGLGMLCYQGALQFQIWTGKKPDFGEMRRDLEEFLIWKEKRNERNKASSTL